MLSYYQGIGLPLDEALKFWRTEFSHKIAPDAFDKQYAYNIRHNYGKEGKRVEYTPHSCVKIISSVPGQVTFYLTHTQDSPFQTEEGCFG